MSPKKEKVGLYFKKESALEFVPSGCQLLDKVLGGGYVLGRITNIVGDKSSGKTLAAIEACANFILKYPKGNIWYHESEAAFDIPYAETLGLPVDKVEFVEGNTIGALFRSLEEKIKNCKDQPGLYIVDSLDAFTDADELERDIDKGSFGAKKAKQLSEMFRRLIQDLSKSNILVIIISQIRDKIGITFGETKGRSGGRALDFYASQVIWLSELKKIPKTVKGITRPVGVQIKAKCKKNKVGMPFRECEFPIIFNYGVDDMLASLEWLKTIKALAEIDIPERLLERTAKKAAFDDELKTKIQNQVNKYWDAIEKEFLPKFSKYGSRVKPDDLEEPEEGDVLQEEV